MTLSFDVTLLLLGGILLFLLILLILLGVLLAKTSRLHQNQQGLQEDLRRVENNAAILMTEMESDTAERMNAIAGNQAMALENLRGDISRNDARQEERLRSMQETVANQLGQFDSRITALRQENTQQLNAIRQTVDEQLSKTLSSRLSASFSQVSQQLEQVHKGLGDMQSLAAGVGDLKKVLSNVKTRGVWGEAQLENLLSDLLVPGQYESNVQIVRNSQERVEFALVLPGHGEEQVLLPIDSKFPMDVFSHLTAASEGADKAAL